MFRYRLYPSKRQTADLEYQLSEARNLYNAALQEKKDAWTISRKSLNYYDQSNQLKEIRAEQLCGLANFSACQDVLRRVDKTFKAFFSRVKKEKKAGFPRFKGKNRFNSFTYPTYGDGCKLKENHKLYLQGIGDIKVKLHREVAGKIKTVTVKRTCEKWYVCFSVECEAEILPFNQRSVGIDVGLNQFATFSNGEQIHNLRFFQAAQKKLRAAQRSVARKKKGSHSRRKAIARVTKIHARIFNQRQHFHHKISHLLINRFGVIVVENLNIKGLAKGMFAKQVIDAGWGSFLDKIQYKAENAGREFVRVNPNGTSQICSSCDEKVPKSLNARVHQCEKCGLVINRDINAAKNILRLGLSHLAQTKTAGLGVAKEAV